MWNIQDEERKGHKICTKFIICFFIGRMIEYKWIMLAY
jgi:hypothetical protein